jgi:hypothetical protein
MRVCVCVCAVCVCGVLVSFGPDNSSAGGDSLLSESIQDKLCKAGLRRSWPPDPDVDVLGVAVQSTVQRDCDGAKGGPPALGGLGAQSKCIEFDGSSKSQ